MSLPQKPFSISSVVLVLRNRLRPSASIARAEDAEDRGQDRDRRSVPPGTTVAMAP